ncbi:uncharacterized protein LOC143218028 isoform X2 [Lasioglossum baleicum]|uniref:uncharacterized protein LOC143218028 isoform X2 n=1 Tax=Lasioglossum baleicum TaxID=434251 RepID=UPI003FCD5210
MLVCRQARLLREQARQSSSTRLRNDSNSLHSVRADELFRIGNAYEIIYKEDQPPKGSLASFTGFVRSKKEEKGCCVAVVILQQCLTVGIGEAIFIRGEFSTSIIHKQCSKGVFSGNWYRKDFVENQ